MTDSLTFLAGPQALGMIRDEGLRANRISVIAGAAGGPKWLILGGLDRALADGFFSKRKKPLHLLGSSIGSWRFAAFAQKNPIKAINAFEESYLKQSYSRVPTTDEVSGESWKILDAYLPDTGRSGILNHPYLRLNMLAVRSKHLLSSESRAALAAGMTMATITNLVSRRSLAFHFGRTLFYDSRDIPPFSIMDGFPLVRVPLTDDNLKPAVMASGSIPMVMAGVSRIPGAPAGTYRDGGMIDYHLDIPFDPDPDHIVLYPHYTNTIIPGWLDKHLSWRKATRRNMSNVLIVCPSKSLISELPFGKIPDRNDFMKFKGRDDERLAYWRAAIQKGAVMGDEFKEIVASGKIKRLVRELP